MESILVTGPGTDPGQYSIGQYSGPSGNFWIVTIHGDDGPLRSFQIGEGAVQQGFVEALGGQIPE